MRKILARVRGKLILLSRSIDSSRVLIFSTCRISPKLTICIGSFSTLRDKVHLSGIGKLVIGHHTSINEYVSIATWESVEIGNYCMIASGVKIMDVSHCHESTVIPMALQGLETAPVAIGDDVWIGTNVVILKGVRIGKGTIIAANSVVTRDVDDFSIVGGVPARVIRKRC